MKKEHAEQFTQALGQVLSGAALLVEHGKQQGVPEALGTDQQRWVSEYLRVYVQLPARDRREARKEAVAQLAQSGMPNTQIAKALGVDEGTVRNDLRSENSEAMELEHEDERPFCTAASENSEGAENTVGERRKANEDARKAILEAPVDPEILPGIYAEDFFTGADRIADESVDLVFTDPPYDKDSVDLYRKAAKVAARILKPGGSFIAYSGQKYLPEVYGLINHPALRYWWTFAGVHSGGNQMLQKLGIRCGWKPIVWYVKGTRGDVSEVLADVVTGAREKEHHEWQQSEAEALHFIEKLTFPGGLVVDFFLGGGTTKVACDRLGRRFIGFEIERETAERAAKRISEAA